MPGHGGVCSPEVGGATAPPPQRAWETPYPPRIALPPHPLPKPQTQLNNEKPKSCSPELNRDPHSNWSPATCLLTALPTHCPSA